MAKVVQFVGLESTIEMFVNSRSKMWSLWVDRQMLFCFVGNDETEAADALQQILERLEKNRGIYTLKIYKKVKDPDYITEKDPCHGSFNFRMMPYEGDTDGTPYYRSLRDELTALKAERDTLAAELDERDDDDDNGVLGKLGSMIIEDPAKLPLMLQSIQGVLNMFTTQTKPTGQPVALGAVSQQQPTKPNWTPELVATIEQLLKKDPQLQKHLQKLATMPDPVFQQLVSMLDNM